MLGKLLKYELKATSRLFIPLYLTIVVFAIINRFLIPMQNLNDKSPIFYNLMVTISMIIYVTLMIGLVLMTLIVMIQRFYKNLLGDEGYLMFTLPVQSQKHIFSKLTISMLWTVVSSIVALFSIVIIASQSNFIPELFSGISILFNKFTEYFGTFSFIASIEIIVLGLLSLASTILTIYAAIAAGHLFNKHKLLISFGMYIVLKTVSQILMMIFAFIFANPAVLGTEMNIAPTVMQVSNFLLLTILYYGIITTGYYVLTNYILKRRLNLE